jgi:S1-C subfamily serine protease
MKRPEEFISYLELQKKAGDPLTLTILRGGQQQDVSLNLGQRPVAQAQPQPRQTQPGR